MEWGSSRGSAETRRRPRCTMTRFTSIFFFFSSRRRHTRLQGDWSSDVCSSDLTPARPGSASVLLYASRRSSGYNVTMTLPATSRQTRSFDDRADALAHFFLRAGEAPRLLAYDDATGCPLDQALAALEWTEAVGILSEDDLIHAARLGADAAAALVERKDGHQRFFIYSGPRMAAPPADPYEGTLLYDEPGVRAYIFAQRVHAIAHFLRATHGVGALIAMLGRRAPELRHIRRWLQALFSEPLGAARSTQLLTGWFATGGAGGLFVPAQPGAPYSYHEVGIDI